MTDEFHLLPIWLLNTQAVISAKNKFWWRLWNNPLLCLSPWNWGQFSLCPEHVPLCDAIVLVMLSWLLPAFSLTLVRLQLLLQPESDVSLKCCNLLCCCQCEMWFLLLCGWWIWSSRNMNCTFCFLLCAAECVPVTTSECCYFYPCVTGLFSVFCPSPFGQSITFQCLS